MTDKQIKTAIKEIIYNNKILTKQETIELANALAYSEIGGIIDRHHKFIEPIKVKLPDTNVGEIIVEKQYEDIAIKVDNLATSFYEVDDDLAGWEWFDSIATIIRMYFSDAEDDDK